MPVNQCDETKSRRCGAGEIATVRCYLDSGIGDREITTQQPADG